MRKIALLELRRRKFNPARFFGFFYPVVEVVSVLNDSFVVFDSKVSFSFASSTNWITRTFLFRNLLPRNSKSQPPGNIMSGRRQFYKLSYFYTGCFGNHSSNGYILTLELTPLTRVLVLQAPNYHQNKQKTGGTIYRLSWNKQQQDALSP